METGISKNPFTLKAFVNLRKIKTTTIGIQFSAILELEESSIIFHDNGKRRQKRGCRKTYKATIAYFEKKKYNNNVDKGN